MRTRTLWVVLAGLAAVSCVLAVGASARQAAAPTITSFSPKMGWIGTKVTITGTNLQGATVSFNNVGAGTVKVNKWGTALVATVGDETQPGVQPITVSNRDGTATSTMQFTVVQTKPAVRRTVEPVVTGFSPMRGHVGARVTVTGMNFAGATSVQVGGVRATYTVPSATTIHLTIPRGAHTGRITVKTKLGVGLSTSRFVVLKAGQL